jgi:DNA-binding PadR family transcriptional regulator
MRRSRPPSPQATRVLRALASQPNQWRYGYDLAAEVNLKSGSLYPILVRLADRGLLEASWEAAPPGKPPRHLYRLTAVGLDQVAQLPADAGVQRRTAPRRQWSQA